MKTAVFLSIREKATRLPKKVVRLIHGKTVCEHLIDRLNMAKRPDEVVMTTSTHPDDSVLCDLADRSGIPYFRGSEEDKLDRYRQAARARGVEFMMIVDGDDLFCSEEHIDAAVDTYEATGADYITQEGLPLGAASFGVRLEALEEVCRLKAESDTEVWGGYFTQTGRFRVQQIRVEDPVLRRPDVRMTLDYEEDLAFFQVVFDALYRPGRIPSFRDIMAYLSEHPEVVALNRSAQEKYEKHLLKAAPVSLKKEQ